MLPKIILIGYPGSQRILKASQYLAYKYLPEFEIIYLNYKGPINSWSTYLQGYLACLKDKNIIFALDDYLVADYIDVEKFKAAYTELFEREEVVCVKLCKSTEQEHIEYPVTTQYSIWDRTYLISLLERINTPWEFEWDYSTNGNKHKLFDKTVLLRTCLDYFCNSSLSKQWEGVRLDGLKQEDIDYLNENNLIK